MSVTQNLRPHQFQLGDVVFGDHTPYQVTGLKIPSYNVNNQDYQAQLADETRMCQDTLQGVPITMTIVVRDNAPMEFIPGAENLPNDLVAKSSKLLPALATEWKADEIRKQWGELKPLIYCNGYGSVRRIYGRPRKFESTRKTKTSRTYRVNCEYARADTLYYSDIEYSVGLEVDADPASYTREDGEAQAWYRILLVGPQRDPEVNIGQDNFLYDGDINAGRMVEISSYPWSRRCVEGNVDGTGDLVSRRTALIGNTKYLDQPRLPPNSSIPMTWTADLTSDASRCLVIWRDAFNTF